jgi:hypothetical protein
MQVSQAHTTQLITSETETKSQVDRHGNGGLKLNGKLIARDLEGTCLSFLDAYDLLNVCQVDKHLLDLVAKESIKEITHCLEPLIESLQKRGPKSELVARQIQEHLAKTILDLRNPQPVSVELKLFGLRKKIEGIIAENFTNWDSEFYSKLPDFKPRNWSVYLGDFFSPPTSILSREGDLYTTGETVIPDLLDEPKKTLPLSSSKSPLYLFNIFDHFPERVSVRMNLRDMETNKNKLIIMLIDHPELTDILFPVYEQVGKHQNLFKSFEPAFLHLGAAELHVFKKAIPLVRRFENHEQILEAITFMVENLHGPDDLAGRDIVAQKLLFTFNAIKDMPDCKKKYDAIAKIISMMMIYKSPHDATVFIPQLVITLNVVINDAILNRMSLPKESMKAARDCLNNVIALIQCLEKLGIHEAIDQQAIEEIQKKLDAIPGSKEELVELEIENPLTHVDDMTSDLYDVD